MTSNVPKQQQKQIEEAERLHRQHYGGEEPAPAPADPDDPNLSIVPADPQPEPEPQPEPAPADPSVPSEPEPEPAPVSGASEPQPAPEPAPEPAPTDPYNGDYDKLLQAHRTLMGKYENEVPRLMEQLQFTQGRVTEMESLLATPPQPAEPVDPNTPVENLLTPEEIEDYGTDMIDVVKRAAREAFGPELTRLRAENAQLLQQLGGVQQTTQMSARQTMLDYLDREVSGWRQINKAPEFVRWTEELDAFSGQPRLAMLKEAFNGNNGPRVAAFFNGFLRENAAFQTSIQNEPAPQPQVDLNSLVAPGRAGDGDDPRAPETTEKTYSQAEIAQFYRDVQSGVYKDNPAEKDRIERDIFEAQAKGRITQ